MLVSRAVRSAVAQGGEVRKAVAARLRELGKLPADAPDESVRVRGKGTSLLCIVSARSLAFVLSVLLWL